jgi:hypothetical protein
VVVCVNLEQSNVRFDECRLKDKLAKRTTKVESTVKIIGPCKQKRAKEEGRADELSDVYESD